MKLETSKKQVGVLSYYNYYIDIIQDDGCYEFWLYKEHASVKMFCIGLTDLKIEIIQNQIENWIELYNKSYVYN